MIKLFRLIVILNIILIPAAHAYDCEGNNKIDIKLSLDESPIQYNHDLSAIEIFELIPQHKNLLLGVTRTRMDRPQIDINVIAQKTFKHYSCYDYDHIHVKFPLEQIVYIPAEIQDNQCMRESISDHEAKHLQMTRSVFEDHLKDIEKEWEKHLVGKSRPAKSIQEVGDVKMDLTKKAYEIIYKDYNTLRTDVIRKNKALDTPQEYKELYERCPEDQDKFTLQFFDDYKALAREKCDAHENEDEKAACLEAVQDIQFKKVWEQE